MTDDSFKKRQVPMREPAVFIGIIRIYYLHCRGGEEVVVDA